MKFDAQERTKGVIKCYFVINKGKWISAREISEFLNDTKALRLGVYGQSLSAIKVSRILKQKLFDDLETKKLNDNKKLYRYNG